MIFNNECLEIVTISQKFEEFDNAQKTDWDHPKKDDVYFK